MRLLGFLLAVVCTASYAAADDADDLDFGRTYTRMFFEGDFSQIWNTMTVQMQQALGSENSLREFHEQVAAQIGAELSIVEERVDRAPGYRAYIRRSLFEKSDRPIVIAWTIDSEERVAGFYVRPQQDAAQSKYLDYETQADLRLPFDGEWYVFWGGRDVLNNYHAASRDQRFAYDMLIVRNGRTHAADGSMNEHYFCWGQPILAPASGTVVRVVSNLPDNPPGLMDADNPPGNHVVIDLGHAEYALLAHMQSGTISVSEGDRVESGDTIGQCGNSGNTSEPHLHFHIQDEPMFGRGEGKPAFFNNYIADGTRVERGEPKRGENIRNETTVEE